MSGGTPDMGKLSPAQKRALLKQLMKRQVRPARFPLSLAQRRLWFLDRLLPGSPAYNLMNAYRMEGTLQHEALEQALNALVARHEPFRTVYGLEGDQPYQSVQAPKDFALKVHDLRHVPEARKNLLAHRFIYKEARRPFDLATGPLFRFRLVALSQTSHILVLIMHHITSDNWSMMVINREIAKLYRAFRQNRPSPLQPLTMQYKDFAIWEKRAMSGQNIESQIAYWKRRLRDMQVTELPADRARPNIQSFHGDTYAFDLPRDLHDQAKQLSRETGASLYMTYLAVFLSLLHRYTGATDINCGSPIANRVRAEVEQMVGFFINVLVLRVNMGGNPSFRDLLDRVKKVALGAYAHPDAPFDRLVQELYPQRDLSRYPLYQIGFQQGFLPPLELDGLHVFSQFDFDYGVARSDIEFNLMESNRGVHGFLIYNSKLFARTTIAQFANHFRNLLQGVLFHPDQRLGTYSLLGETERHWLVTACNDVTMRHPNHTVHYVIGRHAQNLPDRPAVVFGNRVLTYAALERYACWLGLELRRQGVGPEAVVGLHLPRSELLILSMLAVLKAGGAFMPLDPDYPLDRLHYMLKNSQTRVVLTQDGHRGKTAFPKGTLVMDPRKIRRPEPKTAVGKSLSQPDHPAYVIYTSGSTGQPKGTVLTQRGLGNLGLSENVIFEITSDERALQFSSANFDASIHEIFMILVGGAALICGTKDALLPGMNLTRFLKRRLVTAATLTPTALSTLTPTAFPYLRLLIVAGEAASPGMLMAWVAPFRKVYNAYGPTEATVCASYGVVRAGDRNPPIGRPMANYQCHLLDGYHHLAPSRARARLFIGGAGLARGYLNAPALTAAAFLPNPCGDAGSRIYDSGDRARRTLTGTLQFLDRADHQIKIRGFRIELGEIEAALVRHPDVIAAAAAVRQAPSGERQLVAYLQTRHATHRAKRLEKARRAETLRAFLRESLPDYMTPTTMVFLEALPQSLTGKIDRRALPDPFAAENGASKRFESPREGLEQALAEIWREVLGIQRIGVHDNFFEIGGNSLLMVQVQVRMFEDLKKEVSTVQMFQFPTLRAMCEFLEGPPIRQAAYALARGSRHKDAPQQRRLARVEASEKKRRLHEAKAEIREAKLEQQRRVREARTAMREAALEKQRRVREARDEMRKAMLDKQKQQRDARTAMREATLEKQRRIREARAKMRKASQET